MSTSATVWHHIRRSPFQSFGAILIMVITFFVASSFFFISQGLSRVLNYFENKPEITLFLKDGLDKSTVESIQKEISNYPDIKEIRYISKEKALSIYREQNKNNPLLLEMVTANILPASFEISAYNPKVLEDISSNFSQKLNTIDEVVYQKDIVDSLLFWTKSIRQFGLVVISALAIFTFFYVFIIITIKITNRKEEIKISRLLGASSWYVVKPFLLEGLIYGIIGATIGLILSLCLFYVAGPRINQFFSPVSFFTLNYVSIAQLFSVQLVLGSLLGLIASLIGTKRYIKF